MPSDVILKGSVLALYDQETTRNNVQTSCLRLKTSVKLHIHQMMLETSESEAKLWKETKSSKGKKAYVERKVGECFQWKAHGQCSKGDSCSFIHELASQTKRTIVRSRNIFESQDWGRGTKKFSKESGHREESSSDKRGNIPCRYRHCENPSCNYWHPPVCHNYKSETMHIQQQMLVPTCWGWREAQQKVKERWFERISCDVEGVYAIGLCISRFLS